MPDHHIYLCKYDKKQTLNNRTLIRSNFQTGLPRNLLYLYNKKNDPLFQVEQAKVGQNDYGITLTPPLLMRADY